MARAQSHPSGTCQASLLWVTANDEQACEEKDRKEERGFRKKEEGKAFKGLVQKEKWGSWQ